MRDAHYCRAQAELCLQIAGLLSDQEAAADLRTRAAEYLTHADELDELELNPVRSESSAIAGFHFAAE